MIWGLAFLLRELWAGSYVTCFCTHAAWIFQVNAIGQPVWSLFICLWGDGEETGRSHTAPEKRSVGVFPPFHNNTAKDSTCRELIEHFHCWTAQVITDEVRRQNTANTSVMVYLLEQIRQTIFQVSMHPTEQCMWWGGWGL